MCPGVGSIVAGLNDLNGCNRKIVMFGILQMLLAIVIAGAVWSIVLGIQVYNKSNAFYDPLNPITLSFVRPKSD